MINREDFLKDSLIEETRMEKALEYIDSDILNNQKKLQCNTQ